MDDGKRTDHLLDQISTLIHARDDSIRMIGKLVLAHPQLDAGLTAVVMRLANVGDQLTPVSYDSHGAPLYPHQTPEHA